MNRERIVTSYNRSSLWENYDWCAFYDGQEETGIRGWGKTEADAIAALLTHQEEDE